MIELTLEELASETIMQLTEQATKEELKQIVKTSKFDENKHIKIGSSSSSLSKLVIFIYLF